MQVRGEGKTHAEMVSALLDDDGCNFTTRRPMAIVGPRSGYEYRFPEGAALDTLCLALGGRRCGPADVPEEYADVWEFSDGSRLVAVGGVWDLGFEDCECLCFKGAGHTEDCKRGCTHTPDVSAITICEDKGLRPRVTEEGELELILDMPCEKCGRSGSVRVVYPVKEIEW